jgi:hypothetical protein
LLVALSFCSSLSVLCLFCFALLRPLLTIWWPAGWLDAGSGVARLLAASDSSKCEWERETESPWVGERNCRQVLLLLLLLLLLFVVFKLAKLLVQQWTRLGFYFWACVDRWRLPGGLVDWRLVVAEV